MARRVMCIVAAVVLAGPVLADVAQPWGGAAQEDWTNASQATVISDLDRAEPNSALSHGLKKYHWKVIPYEFIDGPKGTMVWAGPETEAPEIALPLGVKGWFAVFVGLFSAPETPTEAWIRLDGDPAPARRSNGNTDYYGNSEEVFFKAAELNENSRLMIGKANHGFPSSCGITHVKLIPLSEQEIARVKADRADTSHKTLAATWDGFSFIYYRSPRTAQELLSEVELYRDTDFGTLILHTPGADKVIYPSKVGHMKGTGFDDYPRVGDRYFVESIEEFARQGINPVKVLIDGAHDVGMKVQVALRPAGWSFYEPFSDYWEPPFFKEHPEWHCVDRDGSPVERMSWAVPQVRRHMIDVLMEMVRFGADGAHIVFNRGYPVVLYEPAFVEAFTKRYGEDPTKVDESDARIVQQRSEFVLAFFRELRTLLDEEAEKRGNGRRLVIGATVLGGVADNLQYGVDVRALVNEGLLDDILVYPWDFGGRSGEFDLAFFREACSGRSIPFRPAMPVHWPDWRKQLDQAVSFYKEGGSGVTFWDAGVGDVYQWCVNAQLGHLVDTVARLQRPGDLKPPRKYLYFHRLGTQIRDGRFPPFWGG